MVFLIVPVLLILVVLSLGGYLRRQSLIEPAAYEELFAHRESEPLRVTRGESGWLVTAAKGTLPIALRSGPSLGELGEALPLRSAGSKYAAPASPLPCERQFFEIDVAAGGTVQTAERVLPLEGAANFRDVGGYVTIDGRRVAWGRLFRADELYGLTTQDVATIETLGIRYAIDLRSSPEVGRRPDRLPPKVIYRHVPIFAKDPIGRPSMLFGRHRLDQRLRRMYRESIIAEGAPAIGKVLHLCADPANLPLLFHCTGGKDRTGVIAALLLHICGVPRDVIVADYSLTNLAAERSLAAVREAFHATKMPPGVRLEQFYPLFSARPEILERAFAYIEKTYDSLDAYLRGAVGLRDVDIRAIRENLVEG